MKLTQELALKQVQTLKLTPQLQLAVKVLQANQLQLSEMVEQELMENPVLETQDSDGAGPEEHEFEFTENTEQARLVQYVKDFEKYFQESQDNYISSYSGDSGVSGEEPSFEEYVASSRTLKDNLEEQLYLSIKTETDRKIGDYLIACLDSNGYLLETVEKVADSLQVSVENVESVLTLVQSFEPTGVAARDLRECLLIQYFQDDLKDSLVYQILDQHLDDLANNRMKEISQRSGASFEEISEAVVKIRNLNPRPASGYLHEVSTAETITPDLFVTVVDDEVIVRLNDTYIPTVNVNRFYQEKIQNAQGLDKSELLYLRKKLSQALWFRQCLEKRKETIYVIGKCIFDIQKNFFKQGVKGLKPLTLNEVGIRVDRHEATVSRVINGKYAHTPAGVFELKFFFSGGMRSDDGEMISTKRIKEIIQQAVDEENTKKPLSDQVLADLLKARGIDVARRTVTKYRETLGIPSSSKRRKYI
ncbi:RNA polymerase factor sigma-54 [bacterium]|jgi:RNA polymerase sigma-54 factor|nr:RNA polymerase factor sigma-54 [bacterium]